MSKIKALLKKTVIRTLGSVWVYRFLSFFVPFRCRMTAEQARETLQTYSPAPACKTALVAKPNQIVNPPQVDLQIVIPCYNCAPFLEQCMDSVLGQQTQYSYHVFLIDDGSKDSTAALLDCKYAGLKNVTVIHKENGGAASARNAGLKKIIGKYVMFVDADDTLPQGAVEALMACAVQHDADIVQGSIETVFTDGKKIESAKRDGIVAPNTLEGFPCGKVYHASLWTNIVYPQGYWFEDTMNHFLLHREGLSCYAVPQTVYAYLQHAASSTAIAVHNKRSVETYWITEMLLSDMEKMGMPYDKAILDKVIWQFVLNINRCWRLPSAIRKCIFVLQGDLLQRYFPNVEKTENESLIMLCKKQFLKYGLYCLHVKCAGNK